MDPGLANQHSLRALDHALQGILGSGLSLFVAAEPLRALRASEARYFVAVDSLPDCVRQASPGRVRRSCIVDKSTDPPKTRLEVCWGSPRYILHSVLDMGSCDWPSRHVMYLDWNVRGSFHNDPHHRRWDNCLNSMTMSGCLLIKLESMLVHSFAMGPWQGCANFGCIKDAVQEWTSSCTVSDPLFQTMYPTICRHFYKGRLPQDYGSVEHQTEMWSGMASHIVFLHAGMRAKMNRWYQLMLKTQLFRPYLGMVLAVCLYVGISKGWWQNIADTPLMRHEAGVPGEDDERPAGTEGLPPGPAGENHDGAIGRSVRLSNHNVQRLRSNCKSGMHLACTIMCMEESWAVMFGIAEITKPSHEEHSKTVVTLKTRRGTLWWRSQMASEHRHEYIQATMDALSSNELMLYLGLRSYRDGGARCEFDDRVSKRIVGTLVDYARCLISREISFYRSYSEDLPGRFASLVHDDAACRRAGVEWVKEAWEELLAAEDAAVHTDNIWLRDYLAALLWPRNTWVREVIISLAETDWAGLPADTSEEVQHCMLGPGSTLEEELAFNVCRKNMTKAGTGKLGRRSIWHRCLTSGILEDSDFRQPCPNIGDRLLVSSSLQSKMPGNIFDSRATEFSLDTKLLDNIVHPCGNLLQINGLGIAGVLSRASPSTGLVLNCVWEIEFMHFYVVAAWLITFIVVIMVVAA